MDHEYRKQDVSPSTIKRMEVIIPCEPYFKLSHENESSLICCMPEVTSKEFLKGLDTLKRATLWLADFNIRLAKDSMKAPTISKELEKVAV